MTTHAHHASDCCDYCGLPISVSRWRAPSAVELSSPVPHYCCFGCRFAAGVTQESGETGAAVWTYTRLGLAVFFTMNVMAFTMALWSGDVYTEGLDHPLAESMDDLSRWFCLLFSLPVWFLLGQPLLDSAFANIRRGQLSTDILWGTSVLSAFVYSAISVFNNSGHIYFEVGCIVLVTVTIGRFLEARGKLQAQQELQALKKLLPDEVRLIEFSAERLIPLDDVSIGARLRILPGEHIPLDGLIARNGAHLDEQLLTGESLPIWKTVGDTVWTGTLNTDGVLEMTVTAAPGTGSLWKLIEQVQFAVEQKGEYAQLADRVTAWFFPVVCALTGVTFFWHWQTSLETALMSSLAVALIACPCALGLATPMAVWLAVGAAARKQILFRNGAALERLAEVRAICFDKTGTLTTGTPTCSRLIVLKDDSEPRAWGYAAALASGSTHPLSQALCAVTSDEMFLWQPTIAQPRSLPGQGIVATDDKTGDVIAMGNLSLMRDMQMRFSDEWKHHLDQLHHDLPSCVWIAWEKQVQGLFLFQETLRSEAEKVIDWCREHRLPVQILTGDHEARGRMLSAALHVPVVAELTPAGKLAEIAAFRRQYGTVAMIGDGINDAPALAAADVGIALGCGAEISRDTASVCLLGNNLWSLRDAIVLSRFTVKIIRQNLMWAFGYNSLGIPLAMTGKLNPAFAAVLMVVSSAFVIANSMRLKNANHWLTVDPTDSGDAKCFRSRAIQPIETLENYREPSLVLQTNMKART